jgi:predicted PP-loop superfamily ATPase
MAEMLENLSYKLRFDKDSHERLAAFAARAGGSVSAAAAQLLRAGVEVLERNEFVIEDILEDAMNNDGGKRPQET